MYFCPSEPAKSKSSVAHCSLNVDDDTSKQGDPQSSSNTLGVKVYYGAT